MELRPLSRTEYTLARLWNEECGDEKPGSRPKCFKRLRSRLMLSGCGGSQPPIGTPGVVPQGSMVHVIPEWQVKGLARAVCPQVVGRPTCLALIANKVSPACVGSSCGWSPIDFQTRYKLPIAKGSGQIVAVVDAGDNPNAKKDSQTTAPSSVLERQSSKSSIRKANRSNYPSYTGWSVEIDLDIEMVSAACPRCTIYLVEASSANSGDLDAAEVEAVKLGAHIVSNSWICYGSNSCVDSSDFKKVGRALSRRIGRRRL